MGWRHSSVVYLDFAVALWVNVHKMFLLASEENALMVIWSKGYWRVLTFTSSLNNTLIWYFVLPWSLQILSSAQIKFSVKHLRNVTLNHRHGSHNYKTTYRKNNKQRAFCTIDWKLFIACDCKCLDALILKTILQSVLTISNFEVKECFLVWGRNCAQVKPFFFFLQNISGILVLLVLARETYSGIMKHLYMVKGRIVLDLDITERTLTL